jgi:dipeptidyl aminopeptidase/acylaminoacyl peptidase
VLRAPLDGGALLDLTPGDRDVPPANRGDADDLTFGPGGRELLFVAVDDPVEAISTNGELWATALDGTTATAPRRLTRNPGWDGAPRLSPDGKRLAWLSQARAGYESDKRRLLLAGPDAAAPRDLTAALDLSVREVAWAGPDRLLFTAEQDGGMSLFQVAAGGGAPERLWHGGQLSGLTASRDGRRAAALLDSFTHPPEVVLLEGGQLRTLTHFTDLSVAGLALGTARRATARGQDGATIPGFIVTPPGHRPGERHPAVVLVHGGPQAAWLDDWHYRWNTMLWAAQGWTVIVPNFRGSSSYGMAWQDAIRGDWGDGPFGDVMAFTDMAVAAGEVDEGRMCAAGASYGGYLVNWINGHTGRFRCLVTHAGDFDLTAAYFDTEELWFPEWEMGGTPFERAEQYRQWSPSRFAGLWKTPTLVTHGELDYRVAVSHAFSTFTALQRRGVSSRLVVFPDEGHWVLKPRNAKAFHDEVFGWIHTHIGPAAGAAGQR